MKICVVTGIFPPDIGGPASYVALLTESLRLVGCDVEVVTYSSGRARPDYPFPVRRISRCIPLPVRLVIALLKIVKASIGSDLIYCNGLTLPSAVAGLLLGKPLVTKVEGDFAWERASNLRLTSDSISSFQARRQNWEIEILRAIRNWALKRSRIAITTSNFLAGLIQRWGYSGPVQVIPNAVEDSFGEDARALSRQDCRERTGFPSKRIVVSVGRFVPWKGFPGVIRAAKSLGDDTVVLIIGEGPERAALAALIRSSGVRNKVFLLGKIARSELPVYLRAADCFVLNSGYESFSHVTLEAMKMGTPVVAARAAGMPELIEDGENGFLFEKDDTGQMVTRIKDCLCDSALRERLAAETAKRLRAYSWSSIFAQTLRVLGQAARKRV